MTDEHDPRYPLTDKKHNPDPERYAREYEVIYLREKVTDLEHDLERLAKEKDDGLSSLQAQVDGLETRYTYGKGILGGIIMCLGVLGFFIVDFVKAVFHHVFHGGHP